MNTTLISLNDIYYFVNINKDFTLPVLKGINMEIMSQDLIGILGPSGSGKTTLLKIIVGEIKPTAGKNEILSKKMHQNQELSFNEIGYLPQDPTEILITELKVCEWLSFIEKYSNFDLEIFNSLKIEIMNEWELHGLVDQKINQLSGGQKQRIALLSVLLKGCNILLLDEPTSMLHKEMGNRIIETIKKYITNFLSCAIVVTHSFEIACKCTRIFELYSGSIRLTGKFDEETYTGNYKKESFQIFVDKWGRMLIPNSLVDALEIKNEVFLTYIDKSLRLTKGR